MHGIYLMDEVALKYFYYKAMSRGCHHVAKACEREMMRRFNKDISPVDKPRLLIVA